MNSLITVAYGDYDVSDNYVENSPALKSMIEIIQCGSVTVNRNSGDTPVLVKADQVEKLTGTGNEHFPNGRPPAARRLPGFPVIQIQPGKSVLAAAVKNLSKKG
ncbi:hypothetical protein OU994_23115 [Pseudoduganella sp. SL102]|uniref:hypothetical protein n=1 Tax=Pseudoduganella sp. SL102 TaxID=2995154 RepID=UPI00248AB771|nr:hypothetical protein [Pseudoduganella sp. SL102]WBS01170.1 hypothetical protein OU994_23115 [Pseudoduganella sp. SL102]